MISQRSNQLTHCGLLLNYNFEELDSSSLFEKGLPLKESRLKPEEHWITPAIEGIFFSEYFDHIRSLEPSERYVVILQIPPKYLGKRIPSVEPFFGEEEKEKNHYPLVPLLDREFTADEETYYVTPHVIIGYYDNEKDTFVANPNYNLYFDPSGLRYTGEQIDFLKEHNQPLYQEAVGWRATTPREILEQSDKTNKVFAEVVAYYQNEQTNKADRNRHRRT